MMGIHFVLQGQLAANRSKWQAEARKRKRDDKKAKRIALRRAESESKSEPKLIEIERLIASRKLPVSSRRCPECKRLMGAADFNGLEIDCCYLCQGVWFDAGELKSLTHQPDDVIKNQMLTRPSGRACPVCQEQMTERVFLPPHNLLIDECDTGHGVYLQEGELRRVFDLI